MNIVDYHSKISALLSGAKGVSILESAFWIASEAPSIHTFLSAIFVTS